MTILQGGVQVSCIYAICICSERRHLTVLPTRRRYTTHVAEASGCGTGRDEGLHPQSRGDGDHFAADGAAATCDNGQQARWMWGVGVLWAAAPERLTHEA